jgi:hypothetical protein
MSAVKKMLPAKAFRFLAKAGGVLALMAFISLAESAPPIILRILRTNSVGHSQVEFHWTNGPTQTTILQCNTNSFATTNWCNLVTGLNVGIPAHYQYTEDRTNKSRFYRIRATP